MEQVVVTFQDDLIPDELGSWNFIIIQSFLGKAETDSEFSFLR